jgi:hypothetical protein
VCNIVFILCQRIKKWNADQADGADSHGFFLAINNLALLLPYLNFQSSFATRIFVLAFPTPAKT